MLMVFTKGTKRNLSIGGLICLAAAGVLLTYAMLQVRTTCAEKASILPGDAFLPSPMITISHAVTIHRPPRDVWPWLVQMGSGRGGWYAYDFIDNRGYHSARHIIPEFQNTAVGSVLPALPGAKDVFVVAAIDQERSLVLAWRQPNGEYQTTWAFVLEQPEPNITRLIVRGRVANGYQPFGLPQWIAFLFGRPAHFIMQRKQLLEIARRVEFAG